MTREKLHKISKIDAEHIVVRKMGFDFEGLGNHWFAKDPFLTHLINGLHFVFPEGEKFFIRSTRHYIDQVPEELAERIDKFFKQEAQHQVEHLHAFREIERQGYEVDSFIKWYKALAYGVIEPVASPELRLATTAALEHYTAVLGEFALSSDLLDTAEPVMYDLLKWHACEEIEHKSVAFDTLNQVDDSYALRLRGFGMASTILFYFWGIGVRHMMRQEASLQQEGERPRVKLRPRARVVRKIGEALAFVVPRALDYLRPGFHPDDHDNYHLATEHLEEIGRLAA